MPAAPRTNVKATKIAYKIMGQPKNLETIKMTPKEKDLERILRAQQTFDVR